MKKLLLVPLVLAACGDNLQPDEDQLAGGAEDSAAVPDTPATTLEVGFTAFPNNCDGNLVELRARFDRDAVPNPFCRFELADGTVIDSCFAIHSFPTAQNVVLTVTDTDTGASGQFEQVVQGPGTLDATLDVSSNGLSISWEGHAIYGGVVDALDIGISISPSENVIVDDVNVFTQTTGTVNVTAAGTYTVKLITGIDFADVGSCSEIIEKTIDVTCHDGH